MVRVGVRPNVISYAVDKWEKVGELFSEMLNQGIHPNATFFNTIMCNLCREGRVKEAQSLLDLMVCVGVRPNVLIYCINGWPLLSC